MLDLYGDKWSWEPGNKQSLGPRDKWLQGPEDEWSWGLVKASLIFLEMLETHIKIWRKTTIFIENSQD